MSLSEDTWAREREAAVDLIRRHGVADARVLGAMGRVRRHLFIPAAHLKEIEAYANHPLAIGYGQTISQPFIVAHMTERLNVRPGEKVLEIGTGSGYQTAVLCEMGADVYSVEVVPELAAHARAVLAAEGYRLHTRVGDGYGGWPEHAPYDAVIGTCAPEDVPGSLVDQLRDGGRMILPVGAGPQRIVMLRKREGTVTREDDIAVAFVPMVRAGRDRMGL